MDSNADTYGRATASHNQLFPLRASLLNVACGHYGLPCMILAHDREVEYCQYRVPDEFINDSIPFPDAGGAFVIKTVQHVNDVARSGTFRNRGIASKIRKENGSRDDHLFLPLHPGEHRLADGAQVWVHATDFDAQEAERKRQWSSDRNRSVH